MAIESFQGKSVNLPCQHNLKTNSSDDRCTSEGYHGGRKYSASGGKDFLAQLEAMELDHIDLDTVVSIKKAFNLLKSRIDDQDMGGAGKTTQLFKECDFSGKAFKVLTHIRAIALQQPYNLSNNRTSDTLYNDDFRPLYDIACHKEAYRLMVKNKIIAKNKYAEKLKGMIDNLDQHVGTKNYKKFVHTVDNLQQKPKKLLNS